MNKTGAYSMYKGPESGKYLKCTRQGNDYAVHQFLSFFILCTLLNECLLNE